MSPFPRGGDSRDVRKNGSPVGHRLCEPYQNSDEEGFPRNQLHPPHIGGGLGGGGCFFASFFAPKKVRELGFGGIPQYLSRVRLEKKPPEISITLYQKVLK